MILLLATVLFSQFRFRMKTERTLRERRSHYRLLANNVADIIILIDAPASFAMSPIRRAGAGTAPGGPAGQIMPRYDPSRGQGKRQIGNSVDSRIESSARRVSNLAQTDAGLG